MAQTNRSVSKTLGISEINHTNRKEKVEKRIENTKRALNTDLWKSVTKKQLDEFL